jgi:hypothetical protein
MADRPRTFEEVVAATDPDVLKRIERGDRGRHPHSEVTVKDLMSGEVSGAVWKPAK